MRMPALDRRPKRRALAEDVLLPDKLVETPGTHPHRQRCIRRDPHGTSGFLAPGFEQLVGHYR